MAMEARPPVQDNVTGCFDTSSGQFLAAWVDNENPGLSFTILSIMGLHGLPLL